MAWGTSTFGTFGFGTSSSASDAVVGTIPKSPVWDLFELTSASVQYALQYLESGALGSSSGFLLSPGVVSLCSGGSFPASNQAATIATPVPASFTAQWTLRLDTLPADFTDVEDDHIFVGAQSPDGSVFGLFISAAGLAYTGGVSYSAGYLQPDAALIPIPGSDDLVQQAKRYVLRVIVNGEDDVAYLFWTEENKLATEGHQLVAVLPRQLGEDASDPPGEDVVITSVRGVSRQACVSVISWLFSSFILTTNVPPIADPGEDQAVRSCSIVQLDGSGSYDPEGRPLTYEWRMVDGPPSSVYVSQGYDGSTSPEVPATGFTDTFESTALAEFHAEKAIVPGDVLAVGGVAYTIASVPGGAPFQVVIEDSQLPDSLSGAGFRLARQGGLVDSTEAKPTFYPDAEGFYAFDLRVHDGDLSSDPVGLDRAVVAVNVLASPLPRGIVPDASFIFGHILDFWRLVEDRDIASTLWSGMAQVLATELYTLWQLEYGKSIIDIQRQMVRRWVHFSPAVDELGPELVTVKTLYSGLDSELYSAAGISYWNASILSVWVPFYEERTEIQFSAQNPASVEVAARELQNKLRTYVHPEFSASVLVHQPSGFKSIRLTAPFYFQITPETTNPLFPAAAENGPVQGASISLVAARTVLLDKSLAGINVQENDLLVVGGATYRIARVSSALEDPYLSQRLVLKGDVPSTISGAWSIPSWADSPSTDFWLALVAPGDVARCEMYNEQNDEVVSFDLPILGVTSQAPQRCAIDAGNIGAGIALGLTPRFTKYIRRSFLRIDELIERVPTLQQNIVIEDAAADEATLWQNVDYFIEEIRGVKGVRFQSGQSSDVGDVWEGALPPDNLWAEYVFVDNSPLIESRYGIASGLTRAQLSQLPDTVDYLSAVQGLWYAYFNGPTIRNLRIGVQILLGLPFAEAAGTIEEIRTDLTSQQGRMLIRDAQDTEVVRSYSFPRQLGLEVNPATGLEYAVGDTVTQFSPLVKGAEVTDWVKDPKWYQGLLNQGLFFEPQKFHKFLVRVDSGAFNLSALLFAQSFIRRIKPTYTDATFFVQLNAAEDDIDVVDTVEIEGQLELYDSPCAIYGEAGIFDMPRAAGGLRNQFDTASDGTVPGAVTWGFDKYHLCPSSGVRVCFYHPLLGGLTPPNTPLVIGEPMAYGAVNDGAVSLPVGGGFGTSLGLFTVPDVADFELSYLRVVIAGSDDGEPADYTLVVYDTTAASTLVELPFSSRLNTDVEFAPNVAAPIAHVLEFLLRKGSGADRNPAWTNYYLWLEVESQGSVWESPGIVEAGTATRRVEVQDAAP